MEQVVYDDVNLSDRYTVIGQVRPMATPSPTYDAVPGGNRNHLRGVSFLPPEIGFTVVVRDTDEKHRRLAARDLASIILKDKPVKVQFSSDCGLYYMAVPTGTLDFHEFVKSGSLPVTMLCLEPAMYGEDKVAVAPNSNLTIDVGGTYRTGLRLVVQAAKREASTGLLRFTLDGQYVQVELPTDLTYNLVIDASERTVVANNETMQLTLNSVWPEVEPGRHVIKRTKGEGEFRAEWTERWL